MTSSPRMQKGYNTQVSEDIDGRLTNKLFQEFSTTESRAWGALYKLIFFLNPQARLRSRSDPEELQISNRKNQGTNKNHFQKDPNPRMSVFLSQSSQEFSPEETSYSHIAIFLINALPECLKLSNIGPKFLQLDKETSINRTSTA